MSAKIEWVEQRLLEWARWSLTRGSGALGYAAVDLASSDGGSGRDGYRESVIPTSDVQASETADAVAMLPSEIRATVECYYLGTGTQAQKLIRLCIAATTMRDRIGKAHRLLCAHWTAQQDRRREEHARIDGLRRGALARVDQQLQLDDAERARRKAHEDAA